MTGKVINSGAASPLILILPIALVMIVLFTAWPLILLLIILSLGWRFWEHYQWKQLCQQVDPFFHRLIKENRGRLTAVDLSLQANLTGRAARQFLEKKAEEYGAQPQEQEQGTVYTFMTASALGNIFDDSEPLSELESDECFEHDNTLQLASASSAVESSEPSSATVQWEEPQVSQSLRNETTTQTSEQLNSSDRSAESLQNGSSVEILEREEMNGSSSSRDLLANETIEAKDEFAAAPTQLVHANGLPERSEENAAVSTKPLEDTADSIENEWLEEEDEPADDSTHEGEGLIQTKLAERLDLHPSTVGKRKSDPDFPEWSQSKDPDGIAWQYIPETKLFVSLPEEVQEEKG